MLPCFVSRFLGESPHLKWFITMVIRCFKLFIDGISQGMGTYDQQACDLTASDGESSPTWAVFLRREGQVELRKKSGGWIILINRDLLWDSFSLWSHGHVVGIRHFQTPSCWTTFFSQRWEFTWHLIRVYTYIYTHHNYYIIYYIYTQVWHCTWQEKLEFKCQCMDTDQLRRVQFGHGWWSRFHLIGEWLMNGVAFETGVTKSEWFKHV